MTEPRPPHPSPSDGRPVLAAGVRGRESVRTAVLPLVATLAAIFVLVGVGAGGRPLIARVAALSVLGAVIFVRARSLPLGLFSPFPAFLGGAVGYVLPVAATLAVAGALTNERAVDDATLSRGVQVITEALLSLCAGYGLSCLLPGRPRTFGRATRWWSPATSTFVAGGAAALGAVALLAFVFVVVGIGALQSASYGERYQLMSGRGPLLVGAQTFIVGSMVLIGHSIVARRSALTAALLIGGFVPLLGWTSLIGSRSALIQFVIGAAVLRHSLGRRLPMVAVVLGASTVLMVASLYSFVRSGIPWAQVLTSTQAQQLNPANSELGAPAITVADVADAVPREERYRLGTTYLEALGGVVPHFIWPDRPVTPAQWYAKRFYPSIAEAGGAFAFSPVAEAYLNFGVPGVLTVFALIGIAIQRVERRFAAAERLPLWVAITYACALPHLLLFSRFDAAGLVKLLGVIVLGQLAAMYVVARLLGFLTTSAATSPAASAGPQAQRA